MNYKKEDLKPLTKYYFEKPIELLVWNDKNDNIQPRKMKVIGFAPEEGKWIVPLNFGDGAEPYYFDHAADIPKDWTPYTEPKEIPIFDCEVGKQYRVVGCCGMDFDRIMFCTKSEPATGTILFGDTMDDKKCIGTAWIHHVYTC